MGRGDIPSPVGDTNNNLIFVKMLKVSMHKDTFYSIIVNFKGQAGHT